MLQLQQAFHLTVQTASISGSSPPQAMLQLQQAFHLTVQTASISGSSLPQAMLQTQQAFLSQKAAASSPLSTTSQATSLPTLPQAMLQSATQQALLYHKACCQLSTLFYHKTGCQQIRPSSTTSHAASSADIPLPNSILHIRP